MIKKVAVAILVVLLAAVCFADKSPTEDIRGAIDEIVEILADKAQDQQVRHDRVVEAIAKKFDFFTMSRIVLGKRWNTTDAEKQELFISRFSTILEYTFVWRIEGYTDEKVRYVGERSKEGKAKVKTLLVSKSAEIPIDYKVHFTDGEWMVYDITVEGVSLVRNFRDTYKAIVRKDGIEGLLAKMDDKIVDLREEAAKR